MEKEIYGIPEWFPIAGTHRGKVDSDEETKKQQIEEIFEKWLPLVESYNLTSDKKMLKLMALYCDHHVRLFKVSNLKDEYYKDEYYLNVPNLVRLHLGLRLMSRIDFQGVDIHFMKSPIDVVMKGSKTVTCCTYSVGTKLRAETIQDIKADVFNCVADVEERLLDKMANMINIELFNAKLFCIYNLVSQLRTIVDGTEFPKVLLTSRIKIVK